MFFAMGFGHAAEDEAWYSFMVDSDLCVEVRAKDIDHAECAMKQVAKERKYGVWTRLHNGCPGVNADDYFYAFSFNCKKEPR